MPSSPEAPSGIRPLRMKGEVQTYLEGSGNDADTASLLVQLLRAKGIPARYVRATVESRADAVMSLTGTSTIQAALRVFERGGIPHEAILGGGGVLSVKYDRVFVEAYLPYGNYRGTLKDDRGKVWVPLDPGFKRQRATVPPITLASLGFDAKATWRDYLTQARTQTPREFIKTKIEALLQTAGGTASYDSLLQKQGPIAQVLKLLPNSLPYRVITRIEETYDLPDALLHKAHIKASRVNIWHHWVLQNL